MCLSLYTHLKYGKATIWRHSGGRFCDATDEHSLGCIASSLRRDETSPFRNVYINNSGANAFYKMVSNSAEW